MNNNKDTGITFVGLGFFGTFTIALIVLKLCNMIDWAWAWVLAPMWLPALVIIVIFIFAALILAGKIDKEERERNRHE